MRLLFDRLRPLLDKLFGLDLRSLAALRIGLALYLLWDLADRARALEAHYTDQGVMPIEFLKRAHENDPWFWDQWGIHWPDYWSLHAVRGDLGWEIFLFALNALLLVGLLVGYKTRLLALVCWLFLVSLQNRNDMILHGGDPMVRMLLFWSLFLPIGARWSIDGVCATRRAYGQSVPTRHLSVGGFALLWQVCLIYWFTAYLKTDDSWRKAGTALYYALSIDLYSTWAGRFLLHNLPWTLKIGTWMTILWEFCGPFLLFVAKERVRMFVVLGFWAFHLIGTGIFMDVWPLPAISSLLWVGLLPGSFWDGLAARWSTLREKPMKAAIVRLHTRTVALRNRRVRALVEARTPLPDTRSSSLGAVTALLFLTIVTTWNLGATPAAVAWISPFLRLDQKWDMFAPYPSHDDGWFVMPAVTKNGDQTDVFTRDSVLWAKPDFPGRPLLNERWRKYFMNLWIERYRYQWLNFSSWSCYATKKYDAPGNQLKSFRVYYMLERTPPPGQPLPPPAKVLLWNDYYCDPRDVPEQIKKTNGIAARNP